MNESRQFAAAVLYLRMQLCHLTSPTCIWRLRWGDPVWVLPRFSASEESLAGLSFGVVCVILRLAVSVEHCDGRTDRQTYDDGESEAQYEMLSRAHKIELLCMQRNLSRAHSSHLVCRRLEWCRSQFFARQRLFKCHWLLEVNCYFLLNAMQSVPQQNLVKRTRNSEICIVM